MAVEIDTATDYSDLLAKLVTFATANGWTELENTSDKVVLQGEGAGSDEIIVAIKKYSNVATDAYGWYLNGYSGYTDGLAFVDQPSALRDWSTTASAAYPAMPLWNSTIPYWFIVSSRRIIVVAKISTTYQMAYLGFYLPYASPGQYPYPMMVGGSQHKTDVTSIPRFSNATSAASAFWRGRASGPSTVYRRMNGGTWFRSVNSMATATSSGSAANNFTTGIFPFNNALKWSVDNITQALDGSAVLTPLQFVDASGTEVGWVGEIDGVFHVSGNGHAAEDIITVDGDDYLVVQDVFRTGVSDYCAVRLT
jgi:hypothetical protein